MEESYVTLKGDVRKVWPFSFDIETKPSKYQYDYLSSLFSPANFVCPLYPIVTAAVSELEDANIFCDKKKQKRISIICH